jgi:DNA repair exonuclease SbcCD nuclease subunit
MRECSINIASTSDIHFGHPRTPTAHIVNSFLEAFPDNAETAALDLIFLCGDVFDRLLTVPEIDHQTARVGIAKFLLRCEKYNITLIVIEGTPRHDRKQSYMFREIIDLLGLKLDFYYVEGCQILYLEKFDLNILCIQDEYSHNPDDTLAEVRRLMAERMLTQVDIALMHGQFEHQLPDVDDARRKCHNAAAYLALVRYVIFIGHDHHFSEFTLEEFAAWIIAHGSLERLIHGEEEPKGHVRMRLDPDGTKSITFVENRLAMDYRTIDVHNLITEDVIKAIRALKLRPGSHVRLAGTVFDMGVRMIRHLRRDFPDLRLSTKPEKEKKGKDEPVATIYKSYVPVQIGQTNTTGMALDWLSRNGASAAEMKDCEDYLNEQINAGVGLKGARAVSHLNGDIAGH